MFFTYSPCWFCGVLNHVLVELSQREPIICKFCCRELPIARGLNHVGGHGLAELVEGTRVPVFAAFVDVTRRPAVERELEALVPSLGSELVFALVDLTAALGLQDQYRVRTYPTFALYFAGREQARRTGPCSSSELVDWLCGFTAFAQDVA